ncbi:MAG: SDR family oxidoreductase [Hyphomicrobiaceae bacterium]
MADGRVLLITGASTGIGAATARLAAKQRFRLVLNARSPDKLAALVGKLGADTAVAAPGSVSDWDDSQAMVRTALDTFGQLDAVFANAGCGSSGGGFAGGDPGEWREMLMTNVYGLALTLRASLPALKAAKGHLLITSSNAGRRPLPGSFYGMTKWAATAVGYNVRAELEGTGVRVTLIEPGIVDTPFFDEPKPDGLHADDVARSVVFALEQPEHVMINEMVIVPSLQQW